MMTTSNDALRADGPAAAQIWRNAAASEAAGSPHVPVPLISVLVPFYQYDCSALVTRLCALALAEPSSLELVLADDGSPDGRFADAMVPVFEQAAVPSTLLRFARNQGRAVIRNLLAQAARGSYLLYLDADMMPDEDDYLARYIALARGGQADIVYGGRSAKFCDRLDPAVQLHRHFTARNETIPAEVRSQASAYHFYSCNFIARREVLAAIPLDEQFVGWGWEDMEWAARASERFTLLHIDNPASHLGLMGPERILAKYDESTGNFQRMLALRPAMVLPTTLYRTARGLKRLSVGPLAKRVSRALAVSPLVPLRVRLVALSMYKAALYSAVV